MTPSHVSSRAVERWLIGLASLLGLALVTILVVPDLPASLTMGTAVLLSGLVGFLLGRWVS